MGRYARFPFEEFAQIVVVEGKGTQKCVQPIFRGGEVFQDIALDLFGYGGKFAPPAESRDVARYEVAVSRKKQGTLVLFAVEVIKRRLETGPDMPFGVVRDLDHPVYRQRAVPFHAYVYVRKALVAVIAMEQARRNDQHFAFRVGQGFALPEDFAAAPRAADQLPVLVRVFEHVESL